MSEESYEEKGSRDISVGWSELVSVEVTCERVREIRGKSVDGARHEGRSTASGS